MAQLTITIPDVQVQRVLDAFAVMRGGPASVAELRAALLEFIKATVSAGEAEAARRTAEATNLDLS